MFHILFVYELMKNLNRGVANKPDRLGLELLEFSKNLTEAQSCISLTGWLVRKHLASIFKEIQGLNLTKYVGECAAAIVEADSRKSTLPPFILR